MEEQRGQEQRQSQKLILEYCWEKQEKCGGFSVHGWFLHQYELTRSSVKLKVGWGRDGVS